mmetsp:Transcript_13988/g.28645  ORF Transcript_13988/g.28645 Transcript_13988/m.28645 type:complete len:203 (-) Transcript_13988:205-813(-)
MAHNHSDHDMNSSMTMDDVMNASQGTTIIHGSQHLMSPFLFTNYKGYYVLFEEAFISSVGGFIGALVLTIITSALVAWFALAAKDWEAAGAMNRRRNVGKFVWGGLAYGIRLGLHYVLMLIAMTMNLWLILALTIGASIGWFSFVTIFGSGRSQEGEAFSLADVKSNDDAVYRGSCQCTEGACDPKSCMAGKGCSCCSNAKK